MADTLESLEIEVKHSASGAADEITKVADAISGLSRALNRSLIGKLADLASAMKELGGAGSPINLNNYTGNTFNKTVQSVRQAAASTPDGEATPLSDELQETIANAGKLEVALHKASDAAEKMNDAFEKGNADSAWRQRERALNAAAQVQREIEKATPKQEPVITPLSDELQDAISSANQIDLLRMKLESLQAALQDAFNNGDQGKALTLRNQILQTESALAKAEKAARGAADGVKELGEESKKAHEPLSMIAKSMARIAFYRVIRSTLKDVGQAFQEGLKNAYAFSQGISTDGNRFAAALDSMSSSGLKMKNQLGSAFIGLLAAIAPIVNAIISLIVRLANALSQLFAAFTGRTYLKANDVSAQFADNMKKGAGAAKEWKNQLLGFDEINRLNEPSGGGGGGAAGIDPSTMFSDTPLDNWAMKFRKFILWCQDHMDLVLDIAKAIGLAILAWKVGSFLSNFLGVGASLSTILGIAMAIAGAFLLVKGYADAWVNGIDWENLTEIFLGFSLAVVGVTLAFGATAGAITALIGGVALLVLGIKEWIETGELSEQTCILLQGGIAAISVALAVLTDSWIPLAIGAVVSLALAIYQNWDTIKEWLSNTWNSIKETATRVWGAISSWFTETWELTKQQTVDTWNEVIGYLKEKWDNITSKAEEVYNAIKDFFVDGFESAKEKITGVLDSLSLSFDNVFGSLIGWCQKACSWLNSVLTGIGLVNNSRGLDSIGGVIAEANARAQSVTRRAGGGFVDDGDIFIAREAGPELVGTVGGRTAVANNDQIVEGIRQGVYDAVLAANANNGGGGEFRLYLDSKQIKYGLERVDRAWGV